MLAAGTFAQTTYSAIWYGVAVMAPSLRDEFQLSLGQALYVGLAEDAFVKARTGTIRRKLIHVPARIVSSARRIRLRLPENWPWQTEWENLFTATHAPPQAA